MQLRHSSLKQRIAILCVSGALALTLFGCDSEAPQNGPVVNDAAAAANMPGGSGAGAPGAPAPTGTAPATIVPNDAAAAANGPK